MLLYHPPKVRQSSREWLLEWRLSGGQDHLNKKGRWFRHLPVQESECAGKSAAPRKSWEIYAFRVRLRTWLSVTNAIPITIMDTVPGSGIAVAAKEPPTLLTVRTEFTLQTPPGQKKFTIC